MSGFCTNCGSKLAGPFCATCGAEDASELPRTDPASSSGPFPRDTLVDATAVSASTSFTQATGSAVDPALYRRWNWGGFLLPAFWPFAHGLPLWGIAVWVGALVLFFISPFNWLAFAIFFGIKGGELAVRNRQFASNEEFLAVERAWSVGGIIAWCVGIPVLLLLIVVRLALMSSSSYYY